MFLYVRTRKATIATAAKEFWFDYEGLHYLSVGGTAGFISKKQILEFSIADFPGTKRCYTLREVEVQSVENNYGDNLPSPAKQRIPAVLNLNNGVVLPPWLARKEGHLTIKIKNRFLNWIVKKLFDR